MTPRVLLVGKDQLLVSSRLLILTGMGYLVLRTENTNAAKEFCRTIHIDILVLCHTVPDAERSDLLEVAITYNQAVKCLWLLDFFGNAVPDGATGFCMAEGPERFVEHIRALCSF